MRGKYFDGKSSRPYPVMVVEEATGLCIKSIAEGDRIDRTWPMSGITIESLSSGNQILLSFGAFPHERLQINKDMGKGIVDDILKTSSPITKGYHQVTRLRPSKIVFGGLICLAAMICTYVFIFAPFIGGQAVKLMPREFEAKAGDAIFKKLSDAFVIDSTKSDLLQEFFRSCHFSSTYDIRLHYAVADEVNAFAVPGGHIVVYEGLINKMEDWDELAALIGHELAHVNQRHSLKQLARSLTSYLIVSVLTGDVAGASSVVLENAGNFMNLSSSRSQEKEADTMGFQYLLESGIRAGAMFDLLGRLSKNEGKIRRKTEFLSTHPLSKRRLAYIQGLIDENPQVASDNFDDAVRIWKRIKQSSSGI